MIGLLKRFKKSKPAGLTDIVDTPVNSTLVLPIQDLRVTPKSLDAVYATSIRAKEIAIHLKNKYPENWRLHINEFPGEDREVYQDLIRPDFDVIYPHIYFTSDRVPIVNNGRHTVLAYRNLRYSDIKVQIGFSKHTKTSEELNAMSFDQITIHPAKR
jgi:hypothetical protein